MEKYFYFIFFYQLLYCLAHSLIASHTNSHSNANTGLITNSNNNNAMLGLMNTITINNNNIIICFSLILQQQQESNPRLPLVYTSNYDYLILLFLTISSRCLIIEQQGIEPHATSVHHITLTAVLYSCAKLSTSSMDYTPLTQQRESHHHLLFAEL